MVQKNELITAIKSQMKSKSECIQFHVINQLNKFICINVIIFQSKSFIKNLIVQNTLIIFGEVITSKLVLQVCSDKNMIYNAILPNAITISERSFKYFYRLKFVCAPNAEILGNQCFMYCRSLFKFYGSRLKELDEEAFSACNALHFIET